MEGFLSNQLTKLRCMWREVQYLLQGTHMCSTSHQTKPNQTKPNQRCTHSPSPSCTIVNVDINCWTAVAQCDNTRYHCRYTHRPKLDVQGPYSLASLGLARVL